MEIDVLIDEGLEAYLDSDWLRSIAKQVLTAQNAGSNTGLGLVITGQEKIRQLNLSYLRKDEPTDVMAFSMLPTAEEAGEGSSTFVTPPDGTLHLGEVIVSYPQAVIQADEQHHSINKEIATLIIHGVLHLMGYDDDKPELRLQMSRREMEIITGLKELQ
jgi:probable rRNA maturation factor